MDNYEKKEERIWDLNIDEYGIELEGEFEQDPDCQGENEEDGWEGRLYYDEFAKEVFNDNYFYEYNTRFDALCDLFIERLENSISPHYSYILESTLLDARESIKETESFGDCIQKARTELKMSSSFRTMWMRYNTCMVLKLEKQEEQVRKIVKKFLTTSYDFVFDANNYAESELFEEYVFYLKKIKCTVESVKNTKLETVSLLNIEDFKRIKNFIEERRYWIHNDKEKWERLVILYESKLNKIDESLERIPILNVDDFSLIRTLVFDEEVSLITEIIDRLEG